jgi:hypothetical protein
MPVFTNTYMNIGLDGQVSFVDNDSGIIVDMGGMVIEFEPRPKESLIESDSLANNGLPNFRKTFDGWELSVRIERSNDNFELYYAQMEAAFFANGAQKFFTIQDRMNNQAGTASTKFQYVGAVLMLETLGQRRKREKVEANMMFHAQTRQPL